MQRITKLYTKYHIQCRATYWTQDHWSNTVTKQQKRLQIKNLRRVNADIPQKVHELTSLAKAGRTIFSLPSSPCKKLPLGFSILKIPNGDAAKALAGRMFDNPLDNWDRTTSAVFVEQIVILMTCQLDGNESSSKLSHFSKTSKIKRK